MTALCKLGICLYCFVDSHSSGSCSLRSSMVILIILMAITVITVVRRSRLSLLHITSRACRVPIVLITTRVTPIVVRVGGRVAVLVSVVASILILEVVCAVAGSIVPEAFVAWETLVSVVARVTFWWGRAIPRDVSSAATIVRRQTFSLVVGTQSAHLGLLWWVPCLPSITFFDGKAGFDQVLNRARIGLGQVRLEACQDSVSHLVYDFFFAHILVVLPAQKSHVYYEVGDRLVGTLLPLIQFVRYHYFC